MGLFNRCDHMGRLDCTFKTSYTCILNKSDIFFSIWYLKKFQWIFLTNLYKIYKKYMHINCDVFYELVSSQITMNINWFCFLYCSYLHCCHLCEDCIDGVMVSVLTLRGVNWGFKPRSVQIKDYEIGICCFSTKYTALRWKSKNWVHQNQDNV